MVSSWTFKQKDGVILELMGLKVDKVDAYKLIAQKFNEARPQNKHKVKVVVTPGNNVQNEIASGQPLPNLYSSYGDAVVKFDALLNLVGKKDVVVNMAEAINWDTNYRTNQADPLTHKIRYVDQFAQNNAKNGNQLTNGKSLDEITHVTSDQNIDRFRPLKDSFVTEGTYNDKLYVAPITKSGMNGIVNKRLLKELVELITGQTQDWLNVENYAKFNYLKSRQMGDLVWPVDDDPTQNNLAEGDKYKLTPANRFRDVNKTLKELVTAFFGTAPIDQDPEDYIANAMQDMSVLEVLLTAYTKLLHTQPHNKNFRQTIGMAIDDEAGFIYAMQQNLKQEKEIYEWDSRKNFGQTLKLNDQTGSKAINQTIDFYRHFAKISPLDSEAGGAGTSDHGFGGLGTKGQAGVYYSDKWVWGGTLTYYGSTAGNPYWTKTSKWTDKISGTLKVPEIKLDRDYTTEFVAALSDEDKNNIDYKVSEADKWAAIVKKDKNNKFYLSVEKTLKPSKPNDKPRVESVKLNLTTTGETKIETKKTFGVFDTDIAVVSSPGYIKAESTSKNTELKPLKTIPNLVQQGPGFAMFKDPNQNKNEIAIDFLNYFLQAQNNTDFALSSGYIPTNHYAYFKTQGEIPKVVRTEDFNYYMQYINYGLKGYNPKDRYQGEWPASVKLFEPKESLKKVVLGVVSNKFKFWTQSPSPFGDMVRHQIISPWIHQMYRIEGSHPEVNMTPETFWSEHNMESIKVAIKNIYPIYGALELESKSQKGEQT
ncbi:hypothetical protein [Williamsoniiplasma lucivorax]|uniref:sn-glycerol-3-phosphate ABC transporter substrate-binding protein n=1 Tax=Williamsoniiplasma lucivorax TaxID=209274 RepID=A0A2S5RF49_9MOLU|nr:hypothetical protein [Williamsoniiplasma lucivorax]PPE05943.1 sn-glycerol-3-phosphate ABC transporter substrate-binding protein [Williamsoniiplasma lucivorax]